MNKKINLILILSLFLFINICVVSANDVNESVSDFILSETSDDLEMYQNSGNDLESSNNDGKLRDNNNKTNSTISTNNNIATRQGSLDITLKDGDGKTISNGNISLTINNKNYLLKTNSKGVASLNIGLIPKTYSIKVSYAGNDKYNPVNSTFKIKVIKSNLKLTCVNKTVIKSNYLSLYLKDMKQTPISNKKIAFTINGKTYYTATNSKGLAKIKIGLNPKIYSIKVFYKGDNFYNSVNNNLRLIVPYTTSITIGNIKVLTNGFLRIYLKCDYQSIISNKKITISINNTKYEKTTSSEGFIVFKPSLKAGNYRVSATYKGTSTIIGSFAVKNFKCIKGNPLNPLQSKIPLVNGVPNIDYMIGGYVLANNGQYTLTKTQYKDVIRRDSYSLFLNGALSKYTFFKSKSEPNFNHIIKREKWNVIERTINTKIVKENKYNYWPSQITVNLKGKQYSYSEVRDVQNTGYTCGPTSCSICSQALRNYVNEQYLGKLAGSNPYSGSSTKGLKIALEKNNMKCSYYYKSSFSTALKELSKGGCALVFHTWNHYVSIIDISKDGKKVLVVNPSGDYNHGSHSIPTNWLSVNYMYNRFNNYDTSGLIVKLNYKLTSSTKKIVNNFYSSMGANWNRHNVNERVPQI